MLFNSIDFILFFPIVAAMYFAAPHRVRWAVLLAASYVFYGWWRVEYLLLIAFSTDCAITGRGS
jgi:alginate O-acetyltransferase complex protein AlgI